MTPDTEQTLSFEAALAQLEAMVEQLEGEDLPLQDAMNTFERSQELIRLCGQQLSEAELKVQTLVRKLEAEGFSYEIEEFEDDEDDDA